MKARFIVPTLSLLLFAGAALAHPGHHHGHAGFMSGVAHPLLGLDHLLAMFAVGLLAAQYGGRAALWMPVAFVGAMLGGAGLAAMGVPLPAVEAGIAASVLVLGVLVALMVRLPLLASVPMVAVFAACHGHAHYVEMGHGSALAFMAGFALATAALHACGYVFARYVPDSRGLRLTRRVFGGAMAVIGVMLLAVQ